jgi:hypothetical protein
LKGEKKKSELRKKGAKKMSLPFWLKIGNWKFKIEN